jgi:sialic acid synthase SpsE|tara:strand:+ start:534 stop:1577 length:1044 start_codon:yes stop_codon:yes gene_type:complete
MVKILKIGKRKVGINYKPLIIAEMGINHNGSLKEAFKLVNAAKKAGVEIIKHQTHIIDDEMSETAKNIYPGNSPKKSIYEIMNDCALSEEDEIKLQSYILKKKMIFISTPFSRKAVDRLVKMNVPAFKIGSGECNNLPLVEYICSFKKPIIMSTGMNSIKTIKNSVKIIKKNKVPYALLHTTNLYPTPYKLVRLGALNDLSKSYPDAIIGLSDHTINNYASFGAIALGASIIERHFTDNYKRKGPDISCSMDINQCKELLEGSNIIFQERGGEKVIIKEEKVTSDFAFATVVAINDIKQGEKFTSKNIWVKRPGVGEIKAKDYKNLIGKTAIRNIKNDKHLKYSDIK